MLTILLAFLLPIPMTATTYDYPAYTQVANNAPIRVDACEASLDIVRGLAHASTLQYGTAFTITGPLTATRLRMRFVYQNTHEETIAETVADITGTFTPGIQISRTHRYGGDFREKRSLRGVARVICEPQLIFFKNGSQWSATPPTP